MFDAKSKTTTYNFVLRNLYKWPSFPLPCVNVLISQSIHNNSLQPGSDTLPFCVSSAYVDQMTELQKIVPDLEGGEEEGLVPKSSFANVFGHTGTRTERNLQWTDLKYTVHR